MISVANVDPTTQTFGAWLYVTNRMAKLFSSNTVTVDASSSGSLSTGNASVNGHFGANSVYVSNNLYGGVVGTPSTLYIGSNVAIANTTANLFSVNATSIQANLNFVTSGDVTIGGNLVVSGANSTFNANVYAKGVLFLGNTSGIYGHIYGGTYTFNNSTTPANVDTFSAASYRGAEYLVTISDTTRGLGANAFHTTSVRLIHDNTTVYLTEYGIIYTGSGLGSSGLGTFSATISGGVVGLTFNPTTANSVMKFVRTGLVT